LHIIHNHVELVKLAIEEQLKLHPKDPTIVCVLLSNKYAASSQWNDITKLKKLKEASHENAKLDLCGPTIH
jgi:hypothetical protein